MPRTDKQGRRDYSREYRMANKTKIKAAMAAYHSRKRLFIAMFKNRPCADCGDWFHPVQMDFDHRPGESKGFNISAPKIKRLSDVYLEMQKCDLVCANCHRLRTYRRNQHGASADVLSRRGIDRDKLSPC